MSEGNKAKNYRLLLFSLSFLVFFGVVFSLGVMTGKRYIPDDISGSRQMSSSEDVDVSSLDDRTADQGATAASEESSARQAESERDGELSAMLDPDHKYTIQVDSFQSKKTANRMVRFYRESGYPAFIREYSPSEITTFYRVRIGTFQTKEKAKAYGNEIKDKEKDFEFYVTVND